MAQDDKLNSKLGDPRGEMSTDETTQLKKRARRRLIGAVALALLAAIVLPMVMDHQPAPTLKDIQVRIPSPDEGLTQRVAPKPAPVSMAKAREEKPAPTEPTSPAKEETPPSPVKQIAKPEQKAEPKPEPKPEVKPEVKPEIKPAEAKPAAEAWEVQLGAYQNPASVTILVGKLKQLGIPTYTEKVDTPNGPRTRVRAGPFLSQEAAEKARGRVKIVGVDGPVAKTP
jgi:DedD protein